jgi:hypothetical protein
MFLLTPVLNLLQNAVTGKQEEVTGPKKLKTDNSQSTDEVTVLNVPLPVVWPLGEEVNVKDVGCGSRHTIVLLGESVLSTSLCYDLFPLLETRQNLRKASLNLTNVTEVHTASIISAFQDGVCVSETSVNFNGTSQYCVLDGCTFILAAVRS